MRKTTTARRPDLILEDEAAKKIWVIDMACPMEKNIDETRKVKCRKYQQLMFEMRERRKNYKIVFIPLVIGCMGGGVKDVRKRLYELFGNDDNLINKIMMEMSKTVLFESESILRKALSGLVQEQLIL